MDIHCLKVDRYLFSSVQFSCSVMSGSLHTHGMQHSRPPCLSPTPRVYPNSCSLNQWFHPTIPSSVFPFSSCLQSFPASGSFQMSQLLASGGQSTGVSASTSVLPMNTQDWSSFRMDWLDLLAAQGTLKSLLQHHSSKASNLRHSAFFIVRLSHPYMTTRKTIALTIQIFVGNIMFLLFNMLSSLVTALTHEYWDICYYLLLEIKHCSEHSVVFSNIPKCSIFTWNI